MKTTEIVNLRAGLGTQSAAFVVPRLNGEDFQIEKSIGEGVFGIVALAKDKRTNERVALKRIDKVNDKVNLCTRESWNQEIMSGSLLVEHEGVAQLKGYFETSRHFWLVLELVQGVSLLQLLEDRRYHPLEDFQAKNLFAQILSAVSYSHSRSVAHLDLKLENVLVDRDWRTKVIDWGLSTTDPINCFKLCGTPEYAAPEMWTRSKSVPFDARAADVFSLGVMLYALLVGRFPFTSCELSAMRRGQEVPALNLDSVGLSENAKDLLLAMLRSNPEGRITAEEILKHPWLLQCANGSS
jgi:serine/threonine protein kinase